MDPEAKKQTILTRNYLTKAVETSYREIGMNLGVPESEEQRIIQALSLIRDKVISAIVAAVPHAVGKKSELGRVCASVDHTIEEAILASSSSLTLAQPNVEFLRQRISVQHDNVKAQIEKEFDLEKDDKLLGPGVDYMTCLDEALLQFTVYVTSRVDQIYEATGAYLCGKCDKIHLPPSSGVDTGFLSAIELIGTDAVKRMADDIKDYQYKKKPFTFVDLKRCFAFFLSRRGANLKVHYRLKGAGLQRLRLFVNSLTKDLEHLTEDEFLHAEIPEAYSTLYGNTRAYYRKRVADMMRSRDLQSVCLERASEEDEEDAMAEDQPVDDSAAAQGIDAVEAVEIVETVEAVSSGKVPSVPNPEASDPGADTLVRMKELYLENPDLFARKLAFLILEPAYAIGFDQGMYFCDHCRVLHVNEDKTAALLTILMRYASKILRRLTETVAPFVQADPAKVSFNEVKEKVLSLLERKSANCQVSPPDSMGEPAKLRKRYLEDLLVMVGQVTSESLSSREISAAMEPVFKHFQPDANASEGLNLTPCLAGRWKDYIAEKATVSEEPQAADVPEDDAVPLPPVSSRPPSDAPASGRFEFNGAQKVAEIDDARIRVILDWAGSLPGVQKKTYIRHEVNALAKILQERDAHPKSLIVYAVLQLEEIREKIRVLDDGSVSTGMTSDDILLSFVNIFRQIGFELPLQRDSAVLVQTRLAEFDEAISALEIEFVALELKHDQGVGIEAQRTHLIEERSALILEQDQKEQERQVLKTSLSDLLNENNFGVMKEKIREASALKTRLGAIFERLEVIAGQLRDLDRMSDECRETVEEMHKIKARLGILHERKRKFIDDVRSLVVQHRQNFQSSPL